MRFNKYLAMCFLASTLMCGSFTSCGDDDDNDKNAPSNLEDGKNKVDEGKTVIEQGRADGKELCQLYNEVSAGGFSLENAAKVPALMALVNKYRNSEDKVYKGAFAEAIVEGYYGTEETGDAAIAKVEDLLSNIDKALNIFNGGNQSED